MNLTRALNRVLVLEGIVSRMKRNLNENRVEDVRKDTTTLQRVNYALELDLQESVKDHNGALGAHRQE